MSDSGQPVPRLSVVVPCFNHGPFLAEAVESALAQTLAELEVIVVDDGSSDPDTRRILDSFQRERTTVLRQPNRGCSVARNAGIRAARGQYILPLDADDRLCPDYAELAVQALDRDPELGIVYCHAEFFGRKSGPWHLPDFSLPGMLRGNQIFASAVYRRADWERVGGYCEDLLLREDYDFWLSLLELERRVLRLDPCLFQYRKHEKARNSKSRRAKRLQEAEVYHRIRCRHAGLFARHPEVLLDWLHELECQRLSEKEGRLGSRMSRWMRGLGGGA